MKPLHPVRDVVLLLSRVLLGVVLVAHGWDKLVGTGLAATGDGFAAMNVPAPQVSAAAAGAVELVGGLLLMLGLLTPLAGVLVALVMAGAFAMVHAGAGVFVADGGWELVAVIGLAALTFAAVGPGRFSLDHLLTSRRSGDRVEELPTGAVRTHGTQERVGATRA